MPAWVFVFLMIAGVLFSLKLMVVAAVAWSLPRTRGALFVSTSRARIEAVFDAVPMNPDMVLVDLGCGDGRVLRAAHRRYGVKGLGFEVNPLAYLMAKALTWRIKKVQIRWGSFWSKEFRNAHVVFCYLFPDVMKPLAEKLNQELGAGAVVISCNFPLPGWNPEQVLRLDSSRHRDPIYVYRIGFDLKCQAGEWEVQSPNAEIVSR